MSGDNLTLAASGPCEVCGNGTNVVSADDARMLSREIGLKLLAGATLSVGAYPGPYRRSCARCYVAELRRPVVAP